ncbi:MAG: TetR/AcrR family transcriptional regulator [Myxococcota bacterium]
MSGDAESSPTADGRTARASRKRASRRRQILDAARQVFAEKGYHDAHVSDVIAAAGIARGTFYLYFESKSAIFLELLDELLRELRESIIGVDTYDGAPPVEAQLVGTVRGLLQKVAENRAMTTIIVREAVGLDDEVERRTREFYDELHGYIRQSLLNGQKMGFVREMNLDVAAFCVLGTIKQLMEQIAGNPDGSPLGLDVDRLTMDVLDFNLRGVIERG